MSEIKILEAAIKLAEKRLSELKLEKPEYPDGTPGYFGDHKLFGYSKQEHDNMLCPFTMFRDKELTIFIGGFLSFTPLETAILGVRYRHEGDGYLGNPLDHILKIYTETGGCTYSGKAEDLSWNQNDKFDYYIIRRAE